MWFKDYGKRNPCVVVSSQTCRETNANRRCPWQLRPMTFKNCDILKINTTDSHVEVINNFRTRNPTSRDSFTWHLHLLYFAIRFLSTNGSPTLFVARSSDKTPPPMDENRSLQGNTKCYLSFSWRPVHKPLAETFRQFEERRLERSGRGTKRADTTPRPVCPRR